MRPASSSFPSAASAIEGDEFAAQALGPGAEDLGELRGIERGEDPPEGVVAGEAVGQCEHAAQPVALGVAKIFHVHETLRAAPQCADGEDQEVTERMAFGASNARVVALAEGISEVVAIGHPELLPNTLSKIHF